MVIFVASAFCSGLKGLKEEVAVPTVFRVCSDYRYEGLQLNSLNEVLVIVLSLIFSRRIRV